MRKDKIPKKLLTPLIIVFIGALLIYLGLRESTVYYYTIEEFKTNYQDLKDKTFRINGLVKDGSIVKINRPEDNLLFDLIDKDDNKSDSVQILYSGAVPDLLVDSAEVVVEGRPISLRKFKATTIITKCPSKYESK